jgi:hypothetical protein
MAAAACDAASTISPVPGSHNVFLDPGPELRETVDQVAAGLARMRGVLPASMQSDTESHYSCASGKSVEETQELLLERTGAVCFIARLVGWAGAPLTPDLLLDMHRGIFLPAFGEEVLSFRCPPGRGEHAEDDGVEFPIWVVAGAGQPPSVATARGVRAKQVMRRLEEALQDFDDQAPGAVGDLSAGSVLLARLYVRLIRIHPFGDGNGRTGWAALQMAAGRLRFPFVQSTPTSEARLALGDAIRHGNRIQPLADHIKSAVWPDE